MKLTYHHEAGRVFLLEEDGTTVCEITTALNHAHPAAIAAELVRRVNAAEELREALQDVLHHPHIQAYLPYAPNDKVMRAAFQAIDKAEGVTE